MSALIAAIAAVVTVLVSALALAAARRWNQAAGARDSEMASALREIAEDLDQVRSLTESAIVEGRRREAVNIPRPRLVGLEGNAEVGVIEVELPPLREVRVDTLVQLAVAKGDAQGPVLPRQGVFSMYTFGTATRADVDEYDENLNEYERTLRVQLEALRAFELDRATVVSFTFRIHNDGLVPLEDSRLVIRFPKDVDGRTAIDKPPELEQIPHWRSGLAGLTLLAPTPRVDLSGLLRREEPLSFAVLSNPARAEWRTGDVQHGEERDSPALHVSCEAGEHTLDWEIHADNLPKPAYGAVPVRVAPNSAVVIVETLAAVGLEDEDELD